MNPISSTTPHQSDVSAVDDRIAEYRSLGQTGLRVSALGFGASALGGVFHAVQERDCIRTVHTALEAGVNFLDVSPYYGLTKAETMLGKALRGIPRDRYILATKCGRYGENYFDFSAPRITASVEESLQRLRCGHIDLIQCHDIEFVSLRQIVNETIPALQKLRQTGKVRFIGITGLPLKIFTEVAARVPLDTIMSYCRYTLFDTSLLTIVPAMQKRGIGIINAAPISMGLLSDRGPPAWHPAPAAIQKACAEAAALCRTKGGSLAKLAVQFAVAEPRIATTVVGTANPENFHSNCRWIHEPIDQDLLALVRKVLAPIHNQTWPSGLPDNHDEDIA